MGTTIMTPFPASSNAVGDRPFTSSVFALSKTMMTPFAALTNALSMTMTPFGKYDADTLCSEYNYNHDTLCCLTNAPSMTISTFADSTMMLTPFALSMTMTPFALCCFDECSEYDHDTLCL
jgi:hypothetical protein